MFTWVGFEQEVFVTPKNNPETPVNLYGLGYPLDGCPYLFELRADPDKEPLKAMFTLKYLQQYWADRISARYCFDFTRTTLAISKKERLELTRQMTKEPSEQYCLYGDVKLNKPNTVTAGLHIHFSHTRERTIYIPTKEEGTVHTTIEVPLYMDIPRMIQFLDQAFKEEIMAAHRQPGLYELKSYGFEYRSLPTTADLLKAVRVLETLKRLK